MVDVMAGETVGVEVAVGVGEGDVEGAGVVVGGIREIEAVLEMVQITTTATGADRCQGRTIGGRKCPRHQRIDVGTYFSGRSFIIERIILTQSSSGGGWV